MDKKIGQYCLVVGALLAIALGLVGTQLDATFVAWLTSLLGILGLIVGYLNITAKQSGT